MTEPHLKFRLSPDILSDIERESTKLIVMKLFAQRFDTRYGRNYSFLSAGFIKPTLFIIVDRASHFNHRFSSPDNDKRQLKLIELHLNYRPD
jgi:hypothetical protein